MKVGKLERMLIRREESARNRPVAYAQTVATYLGHEVLGVRFSWRHGTVQTRFRRVFEN
ncbi:MAG TPA: hypothetical protein VFA29_07845 [Candidatus Baltobacteraceae bacterium]|nr:hypothetical protein [Candidatus Baltobacteraceae bacterium]